MCWDGAASAGAAPSPGMPTSRPTRPARQNGVMRNMRQSVRNRARVSPELPGRSSSLKLSVSQRLTPRTSCAARDCWHPCNPLPYGLRAMGGGRSDLEVLRERLLAAHAALSALDETVDVA